MKTCKAVLLDYAVEDPSLCECVRECWWVVCLSSVCHAQVQRPVLKWQHGGCYSSWCETGWYCYWLWRI